MRFHTLFMLAALFLTPISAAMAQVVPTVPGTTYLAVVGDASGGGVCASGQCVNATRGISLSNYTTAATFNSYATTVTNQFTDVNSQIAGIARQVAILNSLVKEGREFTAATAAMHDAVPNPGDRFAIRINAATVDGIAAAGFSASANLSDDFRLSVNYGGAQGQNVFSGGLNFSFN